MSKQMDIHDARVAALKVAVDLGLDVDGFNSIWRIIVPAALAHPKAGREKGHAA